MEQLRLCKTCGSTKSESEFNRMGQYVTKDGTHKDRLLSDCRYCVSVKRKARIDRIILTVIGEWKCTRCGYSKSKRAIEFHHTNPSDKELVISDMWTYSEERIVKELHKCIALCSNCHREVHDGDPL